MLHDTSADTVQLQLKDNFNLKKHFTKVTDHAARVVVASYLV